MYRSIIDMLSHLVYVSTRKNNCTQEEIEKILDACKRNNKEQDVTGVLLYSDTQFVQYLEGDYKQIINLYDHIKADDRHKNAVMICSSPIQERSFPSWQMGAKKLENITYRTQMDIADKEIFASVLAGQEQQSSKAIALLQKFFK